MELTITTEHVADAGADLHLFGQEVNPETFAVSKSDLFIKDPIGRDADNIAYGSTCPTIATLERPSTT